MLVFDPATGISATDITEVRENVRQDWISAFRKDGQPELDTDPETPAGQLIDSETQHIVEKDNELLYLANMFNPMTSEGIWQDALGKIYFLTRKQHQHSIVECTITGLAGTVIPIGARIKSSADSENQAVWLCSEEVTIPQSGKIKATFISEEHGPITAGSGTLTEISTLVPGWDAVTNETEAILGRYTETQMEFETRRYASVAANARGSISAIYGTISNINNVIDCVVLENIGADPKVEWGVTIPGHSVFISVVGGADSDIAQAIYSKKDAGCGTAGNTTITYQDIDLPGQPVYTYQIQRPDDLPFGVKVKIKETNTTPANIEELIKRAIVADFIGGGPHGTLRVSMAQTVYASRFYCAVLEAGANGLESIEICAPVANKLWADSVVINADQAPVLDANDIEVIMIE